MESPQYLEPPEVAVQRLQSELAAALTRAQQAETELAQLKEAVHAFRVKQEQAARAREAREATQAGPVAAAAAPISQPPVAGQTPAQQHPAQQHPAQQQLVSSPTGTALAEALARPDEDLDARLDRFLEQTLEPDASREWMLEG